MNIWLVICGFEIEVYVGEKRVPKEETEGGLECILFVGIFEK